MINCEVLLLYRRQLHPDLHDLGARRGGESRLDDTPHLVSAGAPNDLRQHGVAEGGEPGAQDQLVLLVPLLEDWVRHRARVVAAFTFCDGGQWSLACAVDVPHKLLTSQVGEELHCPQQQVLTGELDGDHLVEGRNGDDTAGRSRAPGGVSRHGF